MKRHWSTIYLPSCLFSHILQCSSTSLTPFVAQQFATILIQSITYHLSINTFHNPLILNAITSSLILFLHACDHIKLFLLLGFTLESLAVFFFRLSSQILFVIHFFPFPSFSISFYDAIVEPILITPICRYSRLFCDIRIRHRISNQSLSDG